MRNKLGSHVVSGTMIITFKTRLDSFTDKEDTGWWMNLQELSCVGWQTSCSLMFLCFLILMFLVFLSFSEFLKPGAPCEINIDGKTMELTQLLMKEPNRFTYDLASEHVYILLLKKDCYPRFLRSEQYKTLLANAIQPSKKKGWGKHLTPFSCM